MSICLLVGYSGFQSDIWESFEFGAKTSSSKLLVLQSQKGLPFEAL